MTALALVDAAETVLASRRQAVSPVPPIVFGSMPNGDGHLLLSDDEKNELLRQAPAAKKDAPRKPYSMLAQPL